jgi:hypothetical protein
MTEVNNPPTARLVVTISANDALFTGRNAKAVREIAITVNTPVNF